MENNEALKKETFDWAQKKIEEGKFPCKICQHFESVHIHGLCIGCHQSEKGPEHGHKNNCFHPYDKMSNLDLIEWMANNKGEA